MPFYHSFFDNARTRHGSLFRGVYDERDTFVVDFFCACKQIFI